MKEEKRYIEKLNKQLKGLQLRCPIFFTYEVSYVHKTVTIMMNWDSTVYTYEIDFNVESQYIVRQIYLDLFSKNYPRMKRPDGKIYVIDKVNLKTNEVIIKPLDDPNTFTVYTVQFNMPCFMFIKKYCRKNTISEEERWNKFLGCISEIRAGEDIYHEV